MTPPGVERAVARPGTESRLAIYLLRHLQVLFYSLGQLCRAPVSSLMTAAVMGIALALPTGLHVLLANAQQVSGGWDGATQISLFLRHDLDDTRVRAFADGLERSARIAAVTKISPDEALAEFQRLSGFGQALEALDANPLPAVLMVHPGPAFAEPEAAAALVEELGRHPEVDLAQLDLQWVKRLHAIMDIVRRGVVVLGLLLALAVLLVVGNTIRLAIYNRRAEIEIIKLIGGTDAFIRRPFLYTGLWYGLAAGIIAYLLVIGSLIALQGPVHNLTGLYNSRFELLLPDLRTVLTLVGGSMLLGLLGSRLAVGRHLRAIEPS